MEGLKVCLLQTVYCTRIIRIFVALSRLCGSVSRGALPRLRGRREQGSRIRFNTLSCVALHRLQIVDPGLRTWVFATVESRSGWLLQSVDQAGVFLNRIALFTTASQARQRSTAAEANESARRFWLRLGYRKVRDYPPRQFGQRLHACTEFELIL